MGCRSSVSSLCMLSGVLFAAICVDSLAISSDWLYRTVAPVGRMPTVDAKKL